ncbi:MAG: SPFH domain-containing protein [Candidatus Omnitrophota bacterium]
MDLPRKMPTLQFYKGSLSTLFAILALTAVTGMILYFSLLVNVGPNQAAIVMEYRGESVPPENGFIAVKPGQMGIQLEVWREGLHFVNPIFTRVEIVDVVKVPENHVGCVARKFGRDLPAGKIIAGEGEKGVMDIALKPGFYPEYSNAYAYDVVITEAIRVPPGSVGVVTSLAGPLPAAPNQFLSEEGERGVQKQHLTPGTYFLNPYVTRVDLVNIQSRRTDISDVAFPSFDGFPITLNCSVEWRIPEDNAPIVFVKFGQESEVENKVIFPSVLNYSRLIGSSQEATTFISGETRQKFGRDFQTEIAGSVQSVSVEVKETGIRTILPPDEVLTILKDREIAVQQKQQFLQEIMQNAEQMKLQTQKTKAVKEKDIVDKKTEMLKTLLDRQRALDVAVLQAQKEFDAAKMELEAAKNIASASRTLARAEADALLLKYTAEANAQAAAVAAFGEGKEAAKAYANYSLTQSLAPRIEDIFAGTDALWRKTLLGEEVKP